MMFYPAPKVSQRYQPQYFYPPAPSQQQFFAGPSAYRGGNPRYQAPRSQLSTQASYGGGQQQTQRPLQRWKPDSEPSRDQQQLI
jgi:hypothetical protein